MKKKEKKTIKFRDLEFIFYFRLYRGVGDENEVENAVSAIRNTPPPTGEDIELERFLSTRGYILLFFEFLIF